MNKYNAHLPHISHMSASEDAIAGSMLTIDLSALADNYRYMTAQTNGVECAAVIKADAYGMGLEPAAKTFSEAGCRTFFVAHPQEGARARATVPDATIYVLNGLVGDSSDADADYYRTHDLRPVLGCHEEVAIWSDYCARKSAKLPCAIHFDTGMNRLGFGLDDAKAFATQWSEFAPSFEPTLIISHLACGDEPDHPMNRQQLEKFSEIRALFPAIKASLANSGGVLLGPDFHFDLCRPGIALYGGAPNNAQPNPLKVVATLKTRVLATRKVPTGWSVSYGASQSTKRDSRLATLCIGYADGFLRSASSNDSKTGAKLNLNGYEVPIFGRVTMDLIIIDITDVPEDLAKRGEWVEIFGPNVAIDDVATAAGTIGYELLTGLGLRAYRSYL